MPPRIITNAKPPADPPVKPPGQTDQTGTSHYDDDDWEQLAQAGWCSPFFTRPSQSTVMGVSIPDMRTFGTSDREPEGGSMADALEDEEYDDQFEDLDSDELREAFLNAYQVITGVEDVLDYIFTYHEKTLPLRVKRRLQAVWHDTKEFIEKHEAD